MSVLLSPLSLQAADIRRSGEDTFIIQQQRQEALEQQLTPSAPDVRLSAPGSFAHKINFPVETPCFQIKQTELKGADALPHWLPLQKIANGAVGHCLGAKGINLLMSTLQNRLVDHGYVTTRVLAPSQDLKSGILRLVVIPGVVRHVRLTPDSDDYIQLYSSFPAHEGSLLDLRDIEQGLENMQRLPGVQADMEIVPGEQPGESDILITRKQDKYWRLGFSLDDSGIRNDLAWRTPLPEQELYLGMDYGEVGGAGSEYLVGRHLAGGVVGLRGQLFSTDYDLFIGRPFSKPAGFMTSDVTAGFNLFRDF
ncbi:ShlB/FhaC/HecB family hemolysin secretion/activation protein [Escherichia coli]|nr:ShlB/FhaC/HecB family hemolysin secretion/activation protein [Escherichia coli]